MTLHVIRHCETEDNAQRVVQLPEARPSAAGLQQIERIAQRLAALPAPGLALVLSSDLLRARRTAEGIARACGAPLEIDASLAERNFGAWRGRPYAELPPGFLASDAEPPGGESLAAFESRVARAWQRVLVRVAGCPGPVAVVTHGLVLRVLAQRHWQLPTGEAPAVFANTSLSSIEREPPHRALRLACAEHLSTGNN